MTTAIQEYSKTEAALADLSQRYKGVVFPVETRDGMALAIKGRAELRTYRVELEKKRVELKAPSLERTRLIDAEAKRITAELTALEDPLDEAIKAEEGRKAREREEREAAERKRVAEIQEQIATISATPGLIVGRPSHDIDNVLSVMRDEPMNAERYAEFLPLAQAAKAKALETLLLMLAGARAQEKAAAEELARQIAERAELDRLREEQRVREAEEERRVTALAAQEAASRKAIEDADRAAREERDRADVAARAQRAEEDRIAAAERAAESARIAEEHRKLVAEHDAVDARRKAVEAAELELMDGETMLAAFVTKFGKLAEFASVVKAIKAYQAKPGNKNVQAQEAQNRG